MAHLGSLVVVGCKNSHDIGCSPDVACVTRPTLLAGLLEGAPGHAPADHARCIQISTDASLREMIAPGVLVMARTTRQRASLT